MTGLPLSQITLERVNEIEPIDKTTKHKGDFCTLLKFEIFFSLNIVTN